MKAWYESKDPQEQRIIIILGIIIGLALFYLLIWSPISESYAQKTGQVEAQRKLLGSLMKAPTARHSSELSCCPASGCGSGEGSRARAAASCSSSR